MRSSLQVRGGGRALSLHPRAVVGVSHGRNGRPPTSLGSLAFASPKHTAAAWSCTHGSIRIVRAFAVIAARSLHATSVARWDRLSSDTVRISGWILVSPRFARTRRR